MCFSVAKCSIHIDPLCWPVFRENLKYYTGHDFAPRYPTCFFQLTCIYDIIEQLFGASAAVLVLGLFNDDMWELGWSHSYSEQTQLQHQQPHRGSVRLSVTHQHRHTHTHTSSVYNVHVYLLLFIVMDFATSGEYCDTDLSCHKMFSIHYITRPSRIFYGWKFSVDFRPADYIFWRIFSWLISADVRLCETETCEVTQNGYMAGLMHVVDDENWRLRR